MPRSAISGAAATSSARAASSTASVRAVARDSVCERVAREKSPNRSRSTTVRPDPVRRPHPPHDPVDQPGQHRVDLSRERTWPAAQRPLRPHRPAPPSDLDRPRVAADGERVEVAPGRRSEQRDQRRLAELGDLGDRPDTQPVQLLRRHLPDAPQHPDGQRVQERLLAVDRDDEQPVRFRDPAGHLGQELGPRHADRDRQPDPLGHLAPQSARRSPAPGPRSAAGPPRRGTPRRSRCPRPAGWCRGTPRRRPGSPPCTPRTAGGTTTARGHSRRASPPPIAVRTPYALAS